MVSFGWMIPATTMHLRPPKSEDDDKLVAPQTLDSWWGPLWVQEPAPLDRERMMRLRRRAGPLPVPGREDDA